MVNRLLLAEDNKDLRETMALEFRFALPGVELVQADSRESALGAIEAGNLQLVLTDLRMPAKGDGEAVIRAAVAKGIAVIVFSTSIDDIGADVKALCLAIFNKAQVPGLEAIGDRIREHLLSLG